MDIVIVFLNESGDFITGGSFFLGTVTNNMAEYKALFVYFESLRDAHQQSHF